MNKIVNGNIKKAVATVTQMYNNKGVQKNV